MKQQPDVYLFGQVLGTHSFLLRDGFLQPDEYAEIREQYFLPGGETTVPLKLPDAFIVGCEPTQKTLVPRRKHLFQKPANVDMQ